MKPWTEVIAADESHQVLAGLIILAVTVAAGLGLRALTRFTRSLHHLVLVITLTALGVGAIAALALGQLMVFEPDERDVALGVIAITAVLAVVVALVASMPLARDARRVEATLRRIEGGDRSVRTGVVRSDELGHVAQALDELVAQLDELEQERPRFDADRKAMLSAIGHDLRTPLAALQAAVEALADGVAPDPKRYVQSMIRDVEALGSLIEDLVLLSSLDAGRHELIFEPIDIAEIADGAVEGLTPTAAQHGVGLRTDLSDASLVKGNAKAIGHVIRNLIENAIPPRADGDDGNRTSHDRRRRIGGPRHRRRTGIRRGVRRSRVRTLHPSRCESDPRHRWSGSRARHRTGARRGARWTYLDRGTASVSERRRGRLCPSDDGVVRLIHRSFRQAKPSLRDPCTKEHGFIGQLGVWSRSMRTAE